MLFLIFVQCNNLLYFHDVHVHSGSISGHSFNYIQSQHIKLLFIYIHELTTSICYLAKFTTTNILQLSVLQSCWRSLWSITLHSTQGSDACCRGSASVQPKLRHHQVAGRRPSSDNPGIVSSFLPLSR